MKSGKYLIYLLLLLFTGVLLTGCGAEIARASIQTVGQYELSFLHDGRPIALWTDLDVEYIESTDIWYEINFYQSGDRGQVVTCDPYDHEYRQMSRQTVIRGVTKESFLAPMLCEVDLPEGEIQADITIYAEGGRVRIFRADLVIKKD